MRTALSVSVAAIAAAMSIVVLPAIPAAAADSAIVTIGQLEAQGFHVTQDRVGSAPLSDCTVTSVRNPQSRTELVRVNGRGGRDRFIPIEVARNITVSLDCSNR